MSITMEVSPLMSTPSILQGYINLNVGGTFFATSLDTLTRYPGSTLHSMFSKEKISTVPKDETGRCVIDRDGTVFGFILNFLRSGNLNLPTDFTAYEQLQDEADYFQLSDMKKLLITRIESREKQRLALADPSHCFASDTFKIGDRYFQVCGVFNKMWKEAAKALQERAKPFSEGERYGYILQCSPTTFQYVLDFFNGKESFIPRCKEELEKLIEFAEFYDLRELKSCIDTNVHIMYKSE